MIAMLRQKHWMELRGLWVFAVIATALPATMLRATHPGHTTLLAQLLLGLFAFLMLVISVRFAGTGLATSKGIIVQRGPDPSLLFTLSLPLRRRTLFFYRAAFALSVLETAAALGLVIDTAVFVHFGGSWQVFGNGLWVLLAMVPVYFLDCLLSIRFSEASIVFIYVGCMVLALPLFGMRVQKIGAALQGLQTIPFALLALLIAAGLAAVTVWRLDRQDY